MPQAVNIAGGILMTLIGATCMFSAIAAAGGTFWWRGVSPMARTVGAGLSALFYLDMVLLLNLWGSWARGYRGGLFDYLQAGNFVVTWVIVVACGVAGATVAVMTWLWSDGRQTARA